MKLLLAEDTRDLNHVVSEMLKMQGYDVDSAFDGEQALSLALTNGYDGMILDIMMPKKSGLDVLKEVRARNIVTPVIMLTAKTEVDDRVAGLEAGADDYLTKPFAMKELLARVKAMLRRKNDYASRELSFGDLHLSSESLELSAGNTVRLSMKEYELLSQLIADPDHTVDETFLLDHVWNGEEADTETVWLYINFLRNKLSYVDSHAVIQGEKGGPYTLIEEGMA